MLLYKHANGSMSRCIACAGVGVLRVTGRVMGKHRGMPGAVVTQKRSCQHVPAYGGGHVA